MLVGKKSELRRTPHPRIDGPGETPTHGWRISNPLLYAAEVPARRRGGAQVYALPHPLPRSISSPLNGGSRLRIIKKNHGIRLLPTSTS